MTWPPRWDKPHFKEPVSRKVVRGLKTQDRKASEDKAMRIVRGKDKYCRFPLCDCRKFKLRTAVCHLFHRGMGGNPSGDRTVPEHLILLCSARHRENRISLDRGTLKIVPLTGQGMRGPCAFQVDRQAIDKPNSAASVWFEVARESSLHVLHKLSEEQLAILNFLKRMET